MTPPSWSIVAACAALAAVAGAAGAAMGGAGLLASAPIVLVGAWVLARWAAARSAAPVRTLAEAVGSTPRPEATLDELAKAIAREYEDAAGRLRELSTQARRREAALERSEDGAILVDAAGEVDYANPAARALLGGGLSEASPRLRSAELERLVERAVDAGLPVVEEVTIRAPAPRRVLAKVVPLPRGGTVVVLTDLSESMRLDRVRRDFVANVSHELKTPVAAVQALAEVAASALADGDMEAVARFVERLHGDAGRLAGLVSDLLDLSRVEAGSEFERTRIDLRRVAESAADRVRSFAELKGLAVDVDGPRVVIEADAAQMEMAVKNLVDNAVRYSDTGVVRIVVARDAGDAVIEVSDEGVGIPSDHLERIFERFYRVDKARSRATGGTGLGLAIVRHVAENHGGRVEVHSELGRGSVFRLRLPAERGSSTTGTAA